MFFEYGLVLLVVPLALVPELIDCLVNLAGVVVANHLAQLFHLLLGLEMFKKNVISCSIFKRLFVI